MQYGTIATNMSLLSSWNVASDAQELKVCISINLFERHTESKQTLPFIDSLPKWFQLL